MEQTKKYILPDLIKGLTGMYFGHGLPPQQEKRHTRAIAFKEF
jgi:hypothetical protein